MDDEAFYLTKNYFLLLKFIICIIPASIHFYLAAAQRSFMAFSTGSGAYSVNYNDVFSFATNQASLAQLKNTSAGVYSERRFLLKELSLCNVAIALPTTSGNFGVDAAYYGFNQYAEIQIGFAYARKFGSKIDGGVQFDYRSTRMAGYGNTKALCFELGMILHLSDYLQAGIHAFNPGGGMIFKNQQVSLAPVYSLGLGYDASAIFFVGAEIEKEENRPVHVNADMKYKLLPHWLAKAGITTATSNVYMGLGYGPGTLYFEITAAYHQQLGITPGFVLIYRLGSANKNSDQSN